jgi:hypothetical protein
MREMFPWLNRQWKLNRDIEKAKKESQIIAEGFWELYFFAMTYHGRSNLSKVVMAADQGEIEVDPQLLGFYRYLLLYVPLSTHAIFN